MLLEEDDGLDLNLVPDYLKEWRNCEVNLDQDYDPNDDSDVIIKYQLENGKLIPFAAKGEMLLVTGREKSRKTLLIKCMLMSSYTSDPSLTMNFRTVPQEGDLGEDTPFVLYFDTEQPLRRTKKNVRQFYEMAGIKEQDPNLRFFNLKKFSYTQKIEFITHTIEAVIMEEGRRPDIIVIDQIADLAPGRDYNDQLGADNIVNYVNKWSEITGALMILVIHTNRGGKETNGKLGVIFDQKTDTCVLTELNEEHITTVYHRLARDQKIPRFTFRQDFTGRPQLIAVHSTEFNNY